MRRLSMLLAGVSVAGALALGPLFAQGEGAFGPPGGPGGTGGQAGAPPQAEQGRRGGRGGRGGPGGPGGFGGSMESGAREEDRLRDSLTQARLIGAERDAAEAAMKAKFEARRKLTTALEALRTTTEDVKSTEKKLTEAAATYRTALATYRAEVEKQDQTLLAKLSPRSQTRCLAVGILDNGMGMSGRWSRPGGTEGASPRGRTDGGGGGTGGGGNGGREGGRGR